MKLSEWSQIGIVNLMMDFYSLFWTVKNEEIGSLFFWFGSLNSKRVVFNHGLANLFVLIFISNFNIIFYYMK